MVALYRCRTSLKEVEALFGASPPDRADWSGEVWPGAKGLVVFNQSGRRLIAPMTWGLPGRGGAAFAPPRPGATTVWFRELWPAHTGMLAPEHRCVIVMEAFAKPDRGPTQTTRSWFGSDDFPLLGWPGIWAAGANGPGYCGFLVAANAVTEPHANMPALMPASQTADWLTQDLSLASRLARTIPSEQGMYRESTEEPWVAARKPR